MDDLQILDAEEESSPVDPTDGELTPEQIEQLDKIGLALAESRSDAIQHRASSGIENDWIEDKEHYEGIDEANRGELGSWESKPVGKGVAGSDDDMGSTVFFNITRPYCDTSTARLGDMLLPTDDIGWSLDPTPVPDLIKMASGDIPRRIEKQIREQVPEEQQAEVMQQVIDQEKDILDEAKVAAEKASTQIKDWHVECQYNAEMRIVIDDAGQLGTGVMKGPVPENKKQIAFIKGELVDQEEIQPVSRRVPVYNCFPNKACGQNIQNGNDHWEKDDISEKSLQNLISQEGYIESQIRACLDEGPFIASQIQQNIDDGDQFGLTKRDKTTLFEIWYYYGRLKKDMLEAAGLDLDMEEEDFPNVDVHMVMVNNKVIRGAPNHSVDGAFPYDYMVWQARTGTPFGIGIARQIRVPQRIINGAGRNLMDNAGLAGGPMWAFNQGILEPIDGVYEIAPRKGWFVSEDAENVTDIKNAFSFFGMDMMQDDLQKIIQLGMQFAEHISGLPSLLQGQQQEHKETLGGQQMRRNDGSTVLRRIVRQFDDKVTIPQINRYYKYILMYGEDDMKGDFTVFARGSSALIERDLQNESIMQMGEFVMNPAFKLDPAKWMIQWLKSQRLDHKEFEYDDEEWQKVVEQISAPPPDSAVEVANIRAQMQEMQLQFNAQMAQGKMVNDNEQNDKDRMIKLELKTAETELAMLNLQGGHAGKKDVNMDSIKAKLTETILTLKAQVAMNDSDVATPVAEPDGRAPDGQSFEK